MAAVSREWDDMTKPLTILFTNIWLTHRSGTETVVRDLSVGMLGRGHRPIVYSPELGEAAQEMVSKGIVVIDDLRKLAEAPDILHAHHTIPCGEALIRFPHLPAIYVCHAFTYWMDKPVRFPQVAVYAAVDEACRDYLVQAEGIDPAHVVLIPNSVDLNRVPQRPNPLSSRPKRAIAFGKAAGVAELQMACEQRGIAFETIGYAEDRVLAHPERELVNADLVFGSARCALEALCCGCAVVVCDPRGMAGSVTSDNFVAMRARNFGVRTLVNPISIERILRAIDQYDAIDAAAVAQRARREADLEIQLDAFEGLYSDVLDGSRRPRFTPAEHQRAVESFLHENLPRRFSHPKWPWAAQRMAMLEDIGKLETRLAETLRLVGEGNRAVGDAHRAAEEAHRAAESRLIESDRIRQELEARLTNSAAEVAVLKRSRLLRFGRFLRRVAGRPVASQ